MVWCGTVCVNRMIIHFFKASIPPSSRYAIHPFLQFRSPKSSSDDLLYLSLFYGSLYTGIIVKTDPCLLYCLCSNLSEVGQHQFGRLGSLEELHLAANTIQLLQPGTFTGLLALRYLTLANNQINQLHAGVFSGTSYIHIPTSPHFSYRQMEVQK